MSATVDQIAKEGDCAAMLLAMAEVYQRYGRDAVDMPGQPLRAQLVPAQPMPAQPQPAHDTLVGTSS